LSTDHPTPDALPAPPSGWADYALAIAVLVLITAVGLALPDRAYLSIGLVYLFAVILLSLRGGRGPVLLAGVASAVTWEYIFIPPHFQFAISTPQDTLMFITYFPVAMIAGQFAARVRMQAVNDRLREERATALFRLTHALAKARTLDDAFFAAQRQIDRLFAARSMVALANEATGSLVPHGDGSYAPDGAEQPAIEWAFRHRQVAGRSTAVLPDCAGIYLPLLSVDRSIGVLGVRPAAGAILTPAQQDLLAAFAQQISLIVERERLRAATEAGKLLAESEKLHRALLDSVSHELRTPLAVITAALENLDEATPAIGAGLVGEMRTAARRLNRLVGNLLDQTRLESGALRPRLDWCDARDIVNATVDDTRDALAGHALTIEVPEDLPSVRADFALTEHALGNLLLNAALHTPPATPILVAAGLEAGGRRAFLTVSDRGPGLPPALRGRLTMKFARGDAARAGGLGLGLSIVRGFVAAQGGEFVADENPGGGARFTIYLPHPPAQAPVPE
jgi:two-component system sensor histidine kinase KdpD